jgi:hypothetical protein
MLLSPSLMSVSGGKFLVHTIFKPKSNSTFPVPSAPDNPAEMPYWHSAAAFAKVFLLDSWKLTTVNFNNCALAV